MTIFRLVNTLWLVLLLLGACGAQEQAAPATPAGPTVIRVTETLSGGSTALRVGDGLTVELESNASAGYEWRFVEVDPAILKPPRDPEYLPPDDEMPGAPGTSIWRFEAVGPGTTTLKLEYAKPFEEDAPPAKTFAFTVVVEAR